MKCKINFKGKITLKNLTGDETISELMAIVKQKFTEQNFLFDDFKYKFTEEGKENGNIGKKLKVLKSDNKNLEGRVGLIVDDDEHSFFIAICGEVHKIQKKSSSFQIGFEEEKFTEEE